MVFPVLVLEGHHHRTIDGGFSTVNTAVGVASALS